MHPKKTASYGTTSLKGHLALNSSPLKPSINKLSSQHIIQDHMTSHYYNLATIKSAIDSKPPKSTTLSIKKRDQTRREAVLKQIRNGEHIRPRPAASHKPKKRLSSSFDGTSSRPHTATSSWSPDHYDSYYAGNSTARPKTATSHASRKSFGTEKHSLHSPENATGTRKDVLNLTYGGDYLDRHQDRFYNGNGAPFTPRTKKRAGKSFLSQSKHYAPPVQSHKKKSSSKDASSPRSKSSCKHITEEDVKQIDQTDRNTDHRKWIEEQSEFIQKLSLLEHDGEDTAPQHNKSHPSSLSSYARRQIDAEEEELKYLHFINEVTNDILATGIYSDSVLHKLMERHVDRHKHDLSVKKMWEMLEKLKEDLGMTKKQKSTYKLNQPYLPEKYSSTSDHDLKSKHYGVHMPTAEPLKPQHSKYEHSTDATTSLEKLEKVEVPISRSMTSLTKSSLEKDSSADISIHSESKVTLKRSASHQSSVHDEADLASLKSSSSKSSVKDASSSPRIQSFTQSQHRDNADDDFKSSVSPTLEKSYSEDFNLTAEDKANSVVSQHSISKENHDGSSSTRSLLRKDKQASVTSLDQFNRFQKDSGLKSQSGSSLGSGTSAGSLIRAQALAKSTSKRSSVGQPAAAFATKASASSLFSEKGFASDKPVVMTKPGSFDAPDGGSQSSSPKSDKLSSFLQGKKPIVASLAEEKAGKTPKLDSFLGLQNKTRSKKSSIEQSETSSIAEVSVASLQSEKGSAPDNRDDMREQTSFHASDESSKSFSPRSFKSSSLRLGKKSTVESLADEKTGGAPLLDSFQGVHNETRSEKSSIGQFQTESITEALDSLLLSEKDFTPDRRDDMTMQTSFHAADGGNKTSSKRSSVGQPATDFAPNAAAASLFSEKGFASDKLNNLAKPTSFHTSDGSSKTSSPKSDKSSSLKLGKKSSMESLAEEKTDGASLLGGFHSSQNETRSENSSIAQSKTESITEALDTLLLSEKRFASDKRDDTSQNSLHSADGSSNSSSPKSDKSCNLKLGKKSTIESLAEEKTGGSPLLDSLSSRSLQNRRNRGSSDSLRKKVFENDSKHAEKVLASPGAIPHSSGFLASGGFFPSFKASGKDTESGDDGSKSSDLSAGIGKQRQSSDSESVQDEPHSRSRRSSSQSSQSGKQRKSSDSLQKLTLEKESKLVDNTFSKKLSLHSTLSKSSPESRDSVDSLIDRALDNRPKSDEIDFNELFSSKKQLSTEKPTKPLQSLAISTPENQKISASTSQPSETGLVGTPVPKKRSSLDRSSTSTNKTLSSEAKLLDDHKDSNHDDVMSEKSDEVKFSVNKELCNTSKSPAKNTESPQSKPRRSFLDEIRDDAVRLSDSEAKSIQDSDVESDYESVAALSMVMKPLDDDKPAESASDTVSEDVQSTHTPINYMPSTSTKDTVQPESPDAAEKSDLGYSDDFENDSDAF